MPTLPINKTKNIIYTGNNGRKSVLDVVFRPDGKLKPILIFCHGFKGYKDWGCFPQMMDYFAQNGFASLSFNFSHNGGTAENPIDFPDLTAFSENTFTKELFDLDVILDGVMNQNWIPKTEKNTKKIYLLGHSRGGGIALLKAATDSRVKKVATLASVADFKTRFKSEKERAQWKEMGVYYIENGRTKQQMPIKYDFWKDFEANKAILDIPSAVQKITIPQLIVHGTEDPTVLISEARAIKQGNPKAELIEMNGADHTFGAKQPWHSTEFPSDFKRAVDALLSFYQKP